jgi:hypothetical protein
MADFWDDATTTASNVWSLEAQARSLILSFQVPRQ